MPWIARSQGLFALAWLCLACAGQHEPADATDSPAQRAALEPPVLCSRQGADAVRDVFCAQGGEPVQSLRALEDRLSLHFSEPLSEGRAAYPNTIGLQSPESSPSDALVALLGHSTALSGALVSPINPRVLVLSEQVALAFTRGVQQVELAARDRERKTLNFYLVQFEQACNHARGGCTPDDRYGPRIESDWQRVTVEDDEELKNAPSDCRQCHQRGLDTPVLLMRELNGPWQHFFGREDQPPNPFPEANGGDLMRDYLAAKGDEVYAGVSSPVLRATQSFVLRNFVNISQPLVFDGLQIQRERWSVGPDDYASEARRSQTWDAAFAAFQRGEQLALPYFAVRTSDPQKLARLTEAYREREHTPLPELSDSFPDDAMTRAEIGLQTLPGATPAQTLIQACGSCHNDVLDQSVSRARFNIALTRLSAEARERAVLRLRAARDQPGAMPPIGARQLDEAALEPLIAYLQRDAWPEDELAQLERAAQQGMAGAAQGVSAKQ